MDLKTCKKCGIEKESAHFSRKSASRDGLSSHCKQCRSLGGKAYYEANGEKIRERSSEWRKSNPERFRQTIDAWASANAERVQDAKRAWNIQNADKVRDLNRAKYEANRQKVKDAAKVWKAANPEKVKESNRAYEDRNREAKNARNSVWRKSNRDRLSQLGKQWRLRNLARCAAYSAQYTAFRLRATPQWADHAKIIAIYEEAARLTRETGTPHHVDHMVPLQSKLVCGLHWETNLQILPGSENQSKSNRYWPDMP